MSVKVKVRCIGILDNPSGPHAVIASEFRVGAGKDKRTGTYVLMTCDERMALSTLLKATGRPDPLAPYVASPLESAALPGLVRAYRWNADGTPVDVVAGYFSDDGAQRRHLWMNAETLWVSARFAHLALGAFYHWRDEHPPEGGNTIWAPSWICQTAIAALAMAAGYRVPTAEDKDSNDPEADNFAEEIAAKEGRA